MDRPPASCSLRSRWPPARETHPYTYRADHARFRYQPALAVRGRTAGLADHEICRVPVLPLGFSRLGAEGYDDTQGSARCEYVLPAKRINVLPDGVELVFVDDTRELKNPAFPIWLHLWSRPPGGMIDPFTLLCNPSTGTMPGEKRSRKYDFLNGPGVAFACANPADCAQCMGNPFCSTCVSGIKGFPWP